MISFKPNFPWKKALFIVLLFSLIAQSAAAQEEYQAEADLPTRDITTFLPFMDGVQRVTVTVFDDLLLFEGDIMVEEVGSGRGGAASADEDHLWPRSVIPFRIESGHPSAADIRWATQHLTDNTNLCLYEISSSSGVSDYIYFRYKDGVCGSSPIGRQGGRQTIFIGNQCGNTRGSAMHEIMHSVGFYHEQSRDDRDDYVTINFSNITSGHRHNFKKYNSIPVWHWLFPEGQNIGNYDYSSIMHYGRTAFGRPDPRNRSRRLETITPKRSGVTIGQRDHLSAGDIRSINTLYPTAGSCSSSSSTASSDGRGGASEEGATWDYDASSFNIQYDVQLVPQQTGMSCWAAGAAMLVGWRDRVSINPEEIARGIGYWQQYHSGLDASDTTMFAAWGLAAEAPMSYTVQGLVDLVASYGPLWVATAEPGPHIRVIAGIEGDGSPDGTLLTIYDPWQRGMRRFRTPNPGSVYTETYREFMQKQAELAGQEMDEEQPIYVAHN